MQNKIIEELVRDATKVGSIPKSEMRRRIDNIIQSAKKEAVEKLVNSLEYAKPIDKLDNEEVNLRNENLVYGFNMAISKIKQKAKELLK